MSSNEKIAPDKYEPKWPSDVLNRSESAKFLTDYLNRLYGDSSADGIYEDSFVMCLNAEWGYGKTFLIRNWADDLKNKLKHPVIYFDAWKNDFSDDPLLAFISELEIALKEYEDQIPQGKQLVSNVIEIAKGAITPTLKTISKIAFKKIVGEGPEVIFELFNSASEGAINNYMRCSLEEHNKRKEKIKDFSDALGDLLNNLKKKDKTKLPMYIFIDELDRCKPSYAIELLEGIKHIFGTKGVFFIVATNKNQLSHSIKAIYGSKFDSVTYLQRFFDQEYQIPKPNFKEFAKLLIEEKYRLTTLNIEKLGLVYDLTQSFSILSECFELSLRAQDQVAKQLKAIEISNVLKYPVHHWFLLFLMMFRIKNETDYESYLELKDLEDGRSILRRNFKSTEIMGNVGSGFGGEPAKSGSINLIDLLRNYFFWENKSKSSLQYENPSNDTLGRIILSLKANEAIQENYNGKKLSSISISFYRQIIKQAGQLI